MILVHFQGKPFNITVIQHYAPTTNAKEAEVEWFYEDLQDLLELTNSKKRCPFHWRGLECKSRKSSRQVWPCSPKWSRAKFNRILPREHTGHSRHPLPTTQEMTLLMDITRWSIPNPIDYILCSWRWRSAKIRPGADCDSDHEFLIAKFRLFKLKKSRESHLAILVWPKSNPLWLSNGDDE